MSTDAEKIAKEITELVTPYLDDHDLVGQMARLARDAAALLRGVTLTPTEVAVALRWRRTQWESGSFYGYEDERLAARLEASS